MRNGVNSFRISATHQQVRQIACQKASPLPRKVTLHTTACIRSGVILHSTMTDESNPSPRLTVVWRWHCCHCMTVLGETAVGTLLRPRPECSGCGERPRLFILICEGETVVGGRHRATATGTTRRRQSEWMSVVEVHR